MPFTYFTISGGDATINPDGTPAIWYNQEGIVAMTVNGHHYAVFGPSTCTWSGSGTLTSSLDGKDYLSVALLPDNTSQTLEMFRQYAYAHIVDTRVDIVYHELIARLISVFNFITDVKEGTETGTVFSLMRHQWLEAASPLTDYTYNSARGIMKVGVGQSFTTSMVFNGILPAMPEIGYDNAILNSKLETLSGDVGATYAKNLGRAGVMANIADQAGDVSRTNEIVNNLKDVLEGWFTASGNNRVFYYVDEWDRLTGYPGGYFSDTRLTDHHFHYGYFVSAAAVVAKYDPDWASRENWGGMVEMLIRDVSAWGMGFTRGNNQESSSESMNFNAGMIMWGVNTGNTTIRDLGIFMYVHETRAIEQYWWDVDGEVFPDAFDHTAVGMVWSNGGAYGTWFSGNPGAIHGINILPITPGHLYIGRRPDYIPLNYEEGCCSQWTDLFWEFMVFADPDEAMSRSNNGNDRGSGDGGNSNAYFYHHMNSVAAAGRLSTEVTADLPTFAVFDKDQIRTYTAYNPDSEPRIVTFNDGYTMTVPARSQITEQGPVREVYVIKRMSLPENRPGIRILQLNNFGLSDLHGFGNIGKADLYDYNGRKVWQLPETLHRESGLKVPRGIYILKTYE
jgi:endoglucanase Acf2